MSNRMPKYQSINLSSNDYNGLLDDIDEAREIVREMWVFFEHEDPADWDKESGEEIMALQYKIRALSWLYKDRKP